MTLIGVPRESAEGERRVALVPKVVERLCAGGLEVVVESGAGAGALIADEHYLSAGATIGDAWPADVVVKVNPPNSDEVTRLKPGSVLIGFLAPRTRPELADELRLADVTAFAVEAIPRISRAQAMDALSSQAQRGRLQGGGARGVAVDAVLPDADHRGGHGEAGDAAGARCRGGGVAGVGDRQASRRQDHRLRRAPRGGRPGPLGGRAVAGPGDRLRRGEGGYARELTEAERAQQQKALEEAITKFDVVITTALVPGRPAPRLVTAAAVRGMKAGQRRGRPGR